MTIENMIQIETEKALATDWGRNFAADGFRIAHNGGNLTCWIRATASRAMHVCITNEHGDSHYVENGESWLVAMHADSESSFDEYLAHSAQWNMADFCPIGSRRLNARGDTCLQSNLPTDCARQSASRNGAKCGD